MAKETTNIEMADGGTIVFYGEKQKQRMSNYLNTDKPDQRRNKIIKQFSDGSIVVHHFFKYEEKWRGYAIIIGPKGGKSEPIHATAIESQGDLVLCL